MFQRAADSESYLTIAVDATSFLPILAQISDLTEAPLKQVPYNKIPEPSWGRQSPQLTDSFTLTIAQDLASQFAVSSNTARPRTAYKTRRSSSTISP
jgi:hypothetical protein